jgi:hypothetical protein
MQESTSCFTSDSDVFLLPIMLSECFTREPSGPETLRTHTPHPPCRTVETWIQARILAPSPSRGGHCGVEGAQSSLQSATQRGRHRGQSHRGQRPVDRLTRAKTLFARRLHICWEGSPISLSWMCPRKPPSQQEHTIVSSKVRSWGSLRGLHPHGPDASLESALP